MINQTYSVCQEGSQEYAKLVTYIQDDSQEIAIHERPMVVVCPGGAYCMTSDREAEVIVFQMLAMGCNAALLRYSCEPSVFPAALSELAYSVKLIREHAKEWHVAADKIIVMGFSAGGHLAASFGMFWNRKFLSDRLGIDFREQEILKPNGMILCYPVITSGEYAHKDSFRWLLGLNQEPVPEKLEGFEEAYSVDEMMEKLSLEKQVSRDTPKAFIWHTFEDGAVPVENSLLLVSALRKAGISTEFHMYPHGGHGLSLASNETASAPGNEQVVETCQSWIGLLRKWIENF